MSGGPGGAARAAGATAVVVGAGVSGLACARALRAGGVDVSVLDRGRRPGGRLGERSVPLADGGTHLVDTGAAYFTVGGDPRDLGTPDACPQPGTFAEVVHGWALRGLVRPWTDTLHLAGPEGLRGTKTGPLRWAAPGGLRSLADDLAADLAGVGGTVTGGTVVEAVSPGTGGAQLRVRGRGEEVSTRSAGAAVLAMPDPQAARVVRAGLEAVGDGGADAPSGPSGLVDLSDLAAALRDPWDPVVTVWARWAERWWPGDLDAAFVEDDVVSLVADDGRRRGDGEPVLVVHTTAAGAAQHLDDPAGAVEPVLARLGALLGHQRPVPAPTEAGAVRWTFSAPRGGHDEPFWLRQVDAGSGGAPTFVAACGDSWGGRSKVERAWTSGHELGVALAGRLTTA